MSVKSLGLNRAEMPFVLLAVVLGFWLFPSFVRSLTITETTTFPNLYVNGSVSKGSGSFVIDHPLDPRNKLLYHSFVESPDMKNIYDGIAVLDEEGVAVIELPDYFLALNKDFRYLVTPLHTPMPSLHIQREIHEGIFGLGKTQFTLGGGVPGGKVSWQVTGIRHDKTAQAFPIIPEVLKGDDTLVEPGEYIFHEYYGGE